MLMCVLLRSIPMCLAKASLAFKAHWVSHSFKKRALWRTSPGLRGISGVFTTSGHATALPWAHGYARLLACHLEGNKAVHASRRRAAIPLLGLTIMQASGHFNPARDRR